MLGITKRPRKAKRTVDDMTLSECMADLTSTMIKGMVAVAAAAILGYVAVGTAAIIAIIRLAN